MTKILSSYRKLADSTAEGKNYGLPFDNGATIMAIRSDMVEAAGLTVDDFKDTTWSQFEELAKKVVEANDRFLRGIRITYGNAAVGRSLTNC